MSLAFAAFFDRPIIVQELGSYLLFYIEIYEYKRNAPSPLPPPPSPRHPVCSPPRPTPCSPGCIFLRVGFIFFWRGEDGLWAPPGFEVPSWFVAFPQGFCHPVPLPPCHDPAEDARSMDPVVFARGWRGLSIDSEIPLSLPVLPSLGDSSKHRGASGLSK